MAARRTIKKDPLAAGAATETTAEIVGSMPVSRTRARAAAAKAPPSDEPAPATTSATTSEDVAEPGTAEPRRPLVARSRAVVVGFGTSVAHRVRQTLDPSLAREAGRRALGGRLELLGGALGPGWAFIRRGGPQTRLGFLTGDGFIDLESELQAIRTTPDGAEHRILSAIGWGWTAASIFGPAGAIVGGGIRLMHPRLTIVELALRDGRNIVARTDAVTAEALSHLAGMPSWHAAPAVA